MANDETWADRLGSRSFDMLYARAWGCLSWAAVGAVIGAFLGALPATGLPFLTWVVGCAGTGFIAWWAVGLGLGLIAIAGWLGELTGLVARWGWRLLARSGRTD